MLVRQTHFILLMWFKKKNIVLDSFPSLAFPDWIICKFSHHNNALDVRAMVRFAEFLHRHPFILILPLVTLIYWNIIYMIYVLHCTIQQSPDLPLDYLAGLTLCHYCPVPEWVPFILLPVLCNESNLARNIKTDFKSFLWSCRNNRERNIAIINVCSIQTETIWGIQKWQKN